MLFLKRVTLKSFLQRQKQHKLDDGIPALNLGYEQGIEANSFLLLVVYLCVSRCVYPSVHLTAYVLWNKVVVLHLSKSKLFFAS
jgi:hypothetical protein